LTAATGKEIARIRNGGICWGVSSYSEVSETLRGIDLTVLRWIPSGTLRLSIVANGETDLLADRQLSCLLTRKGTAPVPLSERKLAGWVEAQRLHELPGVNLDLEAEAHHSRRDIVR